MARVTRDRQGLAYPISFLILFVGVVLTTASVYAIAVSRISVASNDLGYTNAENKMFSFYKRAESVFFSPNASAVVFFDDYKGSFVTNPTAKIQKINFTVGSINDVVFNSATGNLTYSGLLSNPHVSKFYLAGDNRLVLNGTTASSSQLYAVKDVKGPRIVLDYRPVVSSSTAGTSGGLPLNIVRIYLPNLNSTPAATQQGQFYLKLTSNVAVTSRTYTLTTNPTTATIIVAVNGKSQAVNVPITGNPSGTVIKVQTVINYITVTRAAIT